MYLSIVPKIAIRAGGRNMDLVVHQIVWRIALGWAVLTIVVVLLFAIALDFLGLRALPDEFRKWIYGTFLVALMGGVSAWFLDLIKVDPKSAAEQVQKTAQQAVTQPGPHIADLLLVTITSSPSSNAGEQTASRTSFKKAIIGFLNQTNEPVELYWVDFDGHEVHYASIPPHDSTSPSTPTNPQDTFVGHLWVVRAKNGHALTKYVVKEQTT